MGLSSLRHCNLFGESKGPSYIFYRHISIRMDVVLKLGPELGGCGVARGGAGDAKWVAARAARCAAPTQIDRCFIF